MGTAIPFKVEKLKHRQGGEMGAFADETLNRALTTRGQWGLPPLGAERPFYLVPNRSRKYFLLSAILSHFDPQLGTPPYSSCFGPGGWGAPPFPLAAG